MTLSVKRLLILINKVVIRITNDTTTLNGALSELGETMAANITTKGVSASASDGLTTLAGKILQISGDTPTPATVIYEDDCSIDNTSDYGSSISLRNSGTSTLAYNSDGYYTITNTKNLAESFIPITDLTGLTTNFTLEYDSYVEQVLGSSGLVIYNSSTAWVKLTDDASSDKKYWYGYNDGSFHETAFYGTETSYQKWVHYKYTVQGTTFTMEVTYNDTQIAFYTGQIHFTMDSSTKIGLDSEWNSDKVTRYKNIIVKTIGGGSDCSQYTTQINNAITYINGSGS